MSNEIKTDDYDIKILPIGDLKPYKNNPRQTNKHAIEQVKNSINQNKFSSVIIVDKNLEIIAGHTRLESAKSLGIKELPVFIAKNLDDNAVKRLRMVDNRLNELTPWDTEKLIEETYSIEADEDFKKLFQPLLAEDMKDFDFSDDMYSQDPDEKYNNAIIQYVVIFDNDKQQEDWYSFISDLKVKYPDIDTISARLQAHIKSLNEET